MTYRGPMGGRTLDSTGSEALNPEPSDIHAMLLAECSGHGAEAQVIAANQPLLDLIGAEAAHVRGMTLASLFDEASASGVTRVVTDTGFHVLVPVELRRSDGSTLAVQLTAQPFQGLESGTTYYVVAVHAHGGSRHVSGPVRVSATSPRRAAAPLPRVGWWIVENPHQYAIRCSPTMLEMFGLTQDDIDADPSAFTERWHPEDREQVWSSIRAAIVEGRTVEFRYRVLLPPNEVRWVHARIERPATQTSPFPVIGHVFDVSDELEPSSAHGSAGQRLHAITDVALDGLAILEAVTNESGAIVDFRFAALNAVGAQLLARARDELIGRGVREVLPASCCAPYFEALVHAVERAERLHQTVTNDAPELSFTWATLRVVPIGNAVAVSLRDVGHEKHLEQELACAQRLESVGRLAASVAHDFNNMLSVIGTLNSLVLGTLAPGSRARGDLLDSLSAVTRAAELTRRLLAFSRQQVLRPRSVVLGRLLDELEKVLVVLCGDTVELTLTIDTALHELWIDPGQLEQALVNLVKNAREAMPKGGRVVIVARNAPADADGRMGEGPTHARRYVEISVSDNGIGMDAHTQSHIFDPFFTTKDRERGNGLGLASVFGFVRQSGGHVSVSSTPGAGTSFRLLLPCATERHLSMPPRPNLSDRALSLCSGVVLLVEFDDAVRTIMERILAERGVRVQAMKRPLDAEEWLNRAEDEVPVLISDVSPPSPTSRSLIAAALRTNSKVGLVLTSGSLDGWTGSHLVLALGATLLQRPVTPDRLTGQVSEALTLAQTLVDARQRLRALDELLDADE